MVSNKSKAERYTKKFRTTVKVYHLKKTLITQNDDDINNYDYLGTYIIDGHSTEGILKKVWKQTQNDGSAWSLDPYFNADKDAISFRSSKVGDIFEIANTGYFKVTNSGFLQIEF